MKGQGLLLCNGVYISPDGEDRAATQKAGFTKHGTARVSGSGEMIRDKGNDPPLGSPISYHHPNTPALLHATHIPAKGDSDHTGIQDLIPWVGTIYLFCTEIRTRHLFSSNIDMRAPHFFIRNPESDLCVPVPPPSLCLCPSLPISQIPSFLRLFSSSVELFAMLFPASAVINVVSLFLTSKSYLLFKSQKPLPPGSPL